MCALCVQCSVHPRPCTYYKSGANDSPLGWSWMPRRRTETRKFSEFQKKHATTAKSVCKRVQQHRAVQHQPRFKQQRYPSSRASKSSRCDSHGAFIVCLSVSYSAQPEEQSRPHVHVCCINQVHIVEPHHVIKLFTLAFLFDLRFTRDFVPPTSQRGTVILAEYLVHARCCFVVVFADCRYTQP